jgi:hypothetical protein
MGSGAVTGWPTVLTLSVELPDIAIAGGVVELPRRLQWKTSDGRDLWYTLAALEQVHAQMDREGNVSRHYTVWCCEEAKMGEILRSLTTPILRT